MGPYLLGRHPWFVALWHKDSEFAKLINYHYVGVTITKRLLTTFCIFPILWRLLLRLSIQKDWTLSTGEAWSRVHWSDSAEQQQRTAANSRPAAWHLSVLAVTTQESKRTVSWCVAGWPGISHRPDNQTEWAPCRAAGQRQRCDANDQHRRCV